MDASFRSERPWQTRVLYPDIIYAAAPLTGLTGIVIRFAGHRPIGRRAA